MFELLWVFHSKNADQITSQIEIDLNNLFETSNQKFIYWDYEKNKSQYPNLADYLVNQNIKCCLIRNYKID